MSAPFIIILNGPSSVGKSTTAKAIQSIAKQPFLHLSMDQFLEMVPAPLLDDRQGMKFVQRGPGSVPCLEVMTGPVVEKALHGMRHSIAAMARCGNNLIVDDVMLGLEDKEYRKLLSDCNFRMVGLFAPLEILLKREEQRGDRALGLANWQWMRVHENRDYDLEIDTADKTAEEVAQEICAKFGI